MTLQVNQLDFKAAHAAGDPSVSYHPATQSIFCIGVSLMSLGTILLIILILFLVGALPNWPHSANWGYFPSGGLGLIVIIVLILVLMGRL